jgi:phosphate transport system protein
LTQILDIKKANQIIKNDDKIDKKEKEIRQLATNTLTKRQPLADDLRKILIALKLSGTIERIADHAANIAGRMSFVKNIPESYSTDSIFQLGTMVLANYAKAISSYDKESPKIAKDVPDEDRAINSIYETCFREHLHIMMEDRDSIGFCTQMLFIAKELERIGDLSKVISKEVLYNVEGVIK